MSKIKIDDFEIRQPYVPLNERYGFDIKILKKLYHLNTYLNDTLQDLSRRLGELSIYKKQLLECEKQLNDANALKFDLDNEKIIIKALYSISRTQLVKIENLCTVAMQDILQDRTIKFKIKMEETKKGVDTYFYTVSSAGETDILQSEAGGTKNILSVCLRLIFSEFCIPKVEGPIILDEVGANISAEYQNNFIEFLQQFAEKNNRQIILVSHIQAAHEKSPCLITVYKKGNESFVEGGAA